MSLRLLMIFVPIASHRLMGRVQLHKKEIDEFKEKMEIAQRSGNFLESSFFIFLNKYRVLFSRKILLFQLLFIKTVSLLEVRYFNSLSKN